MKIRLFVGFIFVIGLTCLVLNFLPINLIPNLEIPNSGEEYNAEIGKISSLNDLVAAIDNEAAKKNIAIGSLPYCELCEKYVKERFVWGYSHYSLQENWVAALAGRFVWDDLSGKTEANYILKHKGALCSQQGIVLIEIFRLKKIVYRMNGFCPIDSNGKRIGGHYAVEALVNNHWYYFDPTYEPKMKGEQREISNWMCDRKLFASYYGDTAMFYNMSHSIAISEPNYKVAKNSRIFHKVTWYISKTLWLFFYFLILLIYIWRRHRKFFISLMME